MKDVNSKWRLAPLLLIPLLAAACGGSTANSPGQASPGTSEASSQAPQSPGGTASSACGSETATLTVIHSLTGADAKAAPFNDALEGFAKLCPNITIQETGLPDIAAVQLQYETAKLAGNEPDIVLSNLFAKSTSWLKNGATIDVAPLIDEWGLTSLFNPVALAQWTTSDGRVQAFVYEGFTWPVWYNMSILQKAGISEIPKTTDELIADAAKIRAAGFQPLVVGGKDWSGNKLFSLIIQTMLSDQDAIDLFTNGNWSDPKVRPAIDLFTKLRDAKVFADNVEGLTVENMDADFRGGKAAIVHAGSWGYAALPAAEASNVVLGGFPLPTGAVRDKPVAYADFTDIAFWISPNGAKKLDAARAFITYFYRPEVMGNFVEKAGVLMAVPRDKVEFDESKLNTLYVQAATDLPDRATTVVLSDRYVPSEFQSAFERATSLAYTPGTSTDAIVQALLQAWGK